MKILLLVLFFSFASSSYILPYRDVLLLKTLHRKEKTSAFERSYIIQRIIWLFGTLTESAHVLLRDTILDSVMEKEFEVVRQGTAYSKMVAVKSGGMMSGLYNEENDGLDLSIELQMLFTKTELASVKQFLASTSQEHFFINSCKDKSVSRWQMLAMSEAVMAWKQFSCYFEYIPCDIELLKALNFMNSKGNIRERMDLYLNSYEMFLKPIVHQVDLEYSYAKIMTVYYYFQYLHQISRLFAMYLTCDQVDRLKREHKEFIEDTDLLVSTITLQRTLIGTLPFNGLWLYSTELESGILVPNKYNAIELVAQFRTHMPLQKVSLYRVNLKLEEEKRKGSSGCIRLLVNQKYLELTIHTTRTDWDQVWLGNLVKRLNTGLSTQSDILNMIYS